MNLRRKVAAVVLIATMVVCGETWRVSAQDAPPPDLRMLMNLDLFEPRHNGAQGAPAPAASPSDDSMLDQIRTLDAMGYLGNHEAGGNRAPAPRASAGAQEPAAHQPESAEVPPQSDLSEPGERQIPADHPSTDVEGPQP